MSFNNIKDGERIIIININGSLLFQNYLLSNGITLGTILIKNYSPNYAQLVNLTVAGRILSLRRKDFEHIEFEKI